MQYRYANDRNFEDYASGRVFYTRPGQPAFPVRLASEIFQRAIGHWQVAGGSGLCTIYDPVCGGAYWLGVLAYLHWDAIGAIYASDMDAGALSLAERNLSLTDLAGLEQRINEIKAMQTAYKKESHLEALTSAESFREQLNANLVSHAIQKKVFLADATNTQSIAQGLEPGQVDLILADVPYGWHSTWHKEGSIDRKCKDDPGMTQTPIWQMLDALYRILKPEGMLVVVSDKSQKPKHEYYQQLERFRAGKRQVFMLRPH